MGEVLAAARRPMSRVRSSDAGQAPTATYSHWLTPTNTLSSKNQGDKSAASAAPMSVTVPASANRMRSNGQPRREVAQLVLMRRRP